MPHVFELDEVFLSLSAALASFSFVSGGLNFLDQKWFDSKFENQNI